MRTPLLYTMKFVLHDVVENKDIDQGTEVVEVTGEDDKGEVTLLHEVVKKRNPTVPHPELWLNPFNRYRLYTETKHIEVR